MHMTSFNRKPQACASPPSGNPTDTDLCACGPPASYPFHCDCLDLNILCEQMHAIARAEPLIVAGQPRDYNREVMIAAWKRSQSFDPKPQACAKGTTETPSPPASGQTNGCCTPPKRSFRQVARGAVGLAKATTGIDAADQQAVETRYKTCQRCPHNDCGQCQKCGCWIPVKIRIQSENCPLGNW